MKKLTGCDYMKQNSSCALKTKKRIASALKELMQSASFERITVSDISEKCNIHRQTFYYHFQDRYELLDWLIFNELIIPFVTDFSMENMYDKLYNMFSTMLGDKKFYQSALKINSDDLTRYISRVATEQFTDLVRTLEEKKGIESYDKESDIVIAEFFGYGISGVVMNWALCGMKESPSVMTKRIENLAETCKKLFA